MNRASPLRNARLRWIVKKVFPGGGPTGRALQLLSTNEHRAKGKLGDILSVSHIGVGHILGVDDSDLVMGAYADTGAVSKVIQDWRLGNVAPELANSVVITYVSQFRLFRDLGVVDPRLIKQASLSQTHFRLYGVTAEENLSATKSEQWEHLESVLNEAFADGGLEANLDAYSAILREVAEKQPNYATALFTPMEIKAAFPEVSNEQDQITNLRIAFSDKHLPKALEGAWATAAGSAVPPWVAEVVVGRGARHFFGSAGAVPGWLYVSESVSEIDAFRAWTYNPGFGARRSGDEVFLLFRLEFRDGTHADVEFRYVLSDHFLRNDLLSMIAIGAIRIENYALLPGGELCHIQTFGTLLPPELLEELTSIIGDQGEQPDWATSLELSSSDIVEVMRVLDYGTFGILAPPILNRKLDESACSLETEEAFQQLLGSMSIATRDAARGAPIAVEPLDEAREKLLIAGSRNALRQEAFEFGRLGTGRAYLMIRLDQDAGHLYAFSAHECSNGWSGRRFDCSQHRFQEGVLPHSEQWVEEARRTLEPVAELRGEGVDNLSVSVQSQLEGYPWHEPLIRLGFEQVTLAPTFDSLDKNPFPGHGEILQSGVAVQGYSGVGEDYLSNIESEVAEVSRIYGNDGVSHGERVSPGVRHYCGHAITGAQRHSVGMFSSKGGPFSAADVLGDPVGHRAPLVVLSACSTGVIEVELGSIPEHVSLDKAFVLSGAHAVLSTTAPVNDVIAYLFAIEFHAAFRSGATVWESYCVAREVASGRRSRTQSSYPNPAGLDASLGIASNDWMKFQLTGRIW